MSGKRPTFVAANVGLTGRLGGAERMEVDLVRCLVRYWILIGALVTGLSIFWTTPFAQTETESCLDCHDDAEMTDDGGRPIGVVGDRFLKSIHGDFDCIDCHTAPGDYEDEPHYTTYTPVNCGDCHEDETEAHLSSIHHIGRSSRNNGPIYCADCHGTHYIAEAADTLSMVHPTNIPHTCGACHSGDPVITKDFVRLPIMLADYLESVHGSGWHEGKRTAVCSDCHGSHAIQIASESSSRTNKLQLSHTCGQCHASISEEYEASIHGRALAIGVKDAPTCTDCHDEHLIKKHQDPSASNNPEHIARALCGDCHTDPRMQSRYGVRVGVVESYLDSYHGWAIERGTSLAATCIDCHNVHDIRSHLDPASSVHAANVVGTCGRCHDRSNVAFAQSYTHAGALAARGAHDYARLIYIALIIFVLGGMAAHNAVIARHEIKRHFERRKAMPSVKLWRRAERMQHLVLLLTFIGLAITGFALRYPNAWWVQLIGLSANELLRANLHRALGTALAAAGVYHMVWILVTRRGQMALKDMTPRGFDMIHMFQNMAYHLGLRRERPAFNRFDYTQKAEYWAVIWGTVVMGLTGLVLWFPTLATGWLPSWAVRVSEVVHYYEAILAVSAIVIWHFFFVIFMPSEYPMSTVWINGKTPAEEWYELHPSAGEEPSEELRNINDDNRDSDTENEYN